MKTESDPEWRYSLPQLVEAHILNDNGYTY
jgi:hypothetical protein